MPSIKEPTKKLKAKKDFLDFVKDASANVSLRKKFTKEYYREGFDEKDLYKLLNEWGYDGVRLKDCTIEWQLGKDEAFWARPVTPKY